MTCIKKVRTRGLSQSASADGTIPFGICRWPGLLGFMVAVILLLNSSTSNATNRYWNVPSGDWSTTSNWLPSPGTEPTVSDSAYIQNGGTATVNQPGEVCSILYLGNIYAGTGTVQMSGGSLTSYYAYIGNTGAGNFNHSAGTNTASFGHDYGGLYLGYISGVIGNYNLSGTGQLIASCEYVGYSGTGIFTHSAGTNTVSYYLYLGYNSDASGNYNLNGTGQLSASREYIGYNATATALLEQSGGTNTANYVSIGTNGEYIFTGGTLQINGGLDNQGVLDFDGGPAVMNAANNTIINLALPGGEIRNTQSASLTIGTNSLLIVLACSPKSDPCGMRV